MVNKQTNPESSLSLALNHLLSLPCMVDCYCHQYSFLFPGKWRERLRFILRNQLMQLWRLQVQGLKFKSEGCLLAEFSLV